MRAEFLRFWKVVRGDREASGRQARENFRLFGAPHVAIVTTDAALGTYGAVVRFLVKLNPLTFYRRIAQAPEKPTISFDLSHVGSVIAAEMALRNGLAIAKAARDAGVSTMISAEGSDRTDLVLDLYEQISDEYPETGITLQARLRRTSGDLSRVMQRPGRIRVVKGAFLEPESVAFARDADATADAFIATAGELVRSGHRVSIATHDPELLTRLEDELGNALRGDHVEFEMLRGLGTGLLDGLRQRGFATREYVVYGPEWWLYVLNRIAEHPERVVLALADIGDLVIDARARH
jgi:proline dehydrogenase